jgi:two-component system, NtrC family, sensor kinase
MRQLNLKSVKNKVSFELDKTVILSLIFLPIIHFCLVKLSISILLDNGVAAVWPSSGIYLAGILRLGWRFVPAILLSELLINTWLYTAVYESKYTALIIIIIGCLNTLDPIIIYILKNKFINNSLNNSKSNYFDSPQDIFKFLAIVIGESFFTANAAIATLYLTKNIPWEAYQISWWAWWMALPLNALFVTPPLIIWTRRYKQQPLPSSWQIELLLMVFFIAAISQTSFVQGYPIEYTLLPILVWSAFRFRLQETSLLTLLITIIAIWGTTKGAGSFNRQSTMESLVLLESFIGVFSLTSLLLSAAIRENWWAEFRLKQANETLEERVEVRTLELQDALEELTITQAQVIQSEKMSSLGQLVAGVAHEINNPVNFIYGNISYLQEYTEDLLKLVSLYQESQNNDSSKIQDLTEKIDLEFLLEDMPRVINSMQIGTQRIRDIVISLRNFSRMDEAEYKEVDLHDGIESTLLILQHRIKANAEQPEIEIIRDYGNLPQVECYAGQLNQVFMNILVNAIDAIEESNVNLSLKEVKANSNQIIIKTSVIDSQWIEISISDNGKGMSEDIKNRIFDPFFTTKEIGKGTGMGMAISYQIITEKHHGRLDCCSHLGQGTTFSIQIPIKQ